MILLGFILGLCFTAYGYEFPRHANPQEFRAEDPDPNALFSVYSAYLNHLSDMNWSEARETLQLSEKVYTPPGLDPAKKELESLGQKQLSYLENARRDMENAARLVRLSEFEEARDELESARFWLAKANKNAEEFSSIANNLSSELGIDLPSSFRENYKILENSLRSTTNEVRRALEGDIENVSWEAAYRPNIEVTVPENVFPGEMFTVEGTLKTAGVAHSGITVRLNWLNQNETLITDNNGDFSVSLDVPPDISAGNHFLRIRTQPENNIESATLKEKILVVRISSNLEVKSSRLALSGTSLTVRGKVFSDNGAPGESEIKLVFSGESFFVETSESGEFVTSVDVSMTTFSGSHDYEIVAVPENPRIASCREEESVVVLNPLTLVFAPVLVGFVLVTWRRRYGESGERKEISTAGTTGERSVSRSGEGNVGTIKGMFLKAIGAVEEFTGVKIGPSQTIREYLSVMRNRLGRVYEPFERLSLEFEEFLYSDHEVEEDSSILDRILNHIKGE